MFGWVDQMVQNLNYWGLALLMFLENVFPPIPSEVVMPLGGFLSTQSGSMSFAGVVLAGIAGTMAGAVLLYYVGVMFDAERVEEWAAEHGHWILLEPGEVRTARRWFERYGKAVVFFGRLVPGVRSLVSIPAGSVGMNIWQFLIYTLAGSAIWIALLAYAGRILGENYAQVGDVLEWVSYGVAALTAATIVWWIVKNLRER